MKPNVAPQVTPVRRHCRVMSGVNLFNEREAARADDRKARPYRLPRREAEGLSLENSIGLRRDRATMPDGCFSRFASVNVTLTLILLLSIATRGIFTYGIFVHRGELS
jgi:hypothetical protein